MLEAIANADQASDDRKKRENHQRDQHHHRTLVWFAVPVVIVIVNGTSLPMRVHLSAVIVTEKCHEQQPKHVERSDESGDDADQPEHPTPVVAGVGLPENFVFTPKAGKWGNSCDG